MNSSLVSLAEISRVESSENRSKIHFVQLGRSLVYIKNRSSPNKFPCGTVVNI